jgi:hypothetical protein
MKTETIGNLETFEIHITGIGPEINRALNLFGLKNIIIDLLAPGGETLITEYMSSIRKKFEGFTECKVWVDELCSLLVNEGVEIQRVKIEVPFNEKYIFHSIYIESHFEPIDWDFRSQKIFQKLPLNSLQQTGSMIIQSLVNFMPNIILV